MGNGNCAPRVFPFTMRFIQAGKRVMGFYAADPSRRRVNLTNVVQLEVEFPGQVLLAAYGAPDDITARLTEWLSAWRQPVNS